MKPTVVLLHGLGRTHRSMSLLRRRITEAGYSTWAESYPSTRHSIHDLAADVADRVRAEVGEGPVIGITHSLGGILARHIGERLAWRGLVMLAPPNRGSRLAATFRYHPLYRWFYGPAGQELATPATWPAPPNPFVVIAGTAGLSATNPTSWAVRSLKLLPREAVTDGTVAIAETQLDGMAGYHEVQTGHTFIMNHPTVLELVLDYLSRWSDP